MERNATLLGSERRRRVLKKHMQHESGGIVIKAILTDSHFWIPVIVLAAGLALLVLLH